jgi:hypothetical protein
MVGVIVMVDTTVEAVRFVAVKEAIVGPVPLLASPMELLLFVHGKVLPVTVPLKVTAVVLAPLHTGV